MNRKKFLKITMAGTGNLVMLPFFIGASQKHHINTAGEDIVTPDYKNPLLPVDTRVKDLIGRMTLAEKVAQMLCIWQQKESLLFDENGNLDLAGFQAKMEHGVGQIGRLSDARGGLTALEMARTANSLQKYFTEQTRLGIPVIFHEECLHGLAAKEATSYPQPIGMAASFNPELIEEIYSVIASDTRSRGAHQALTPVVDVARDPRWGRVEETFGEDPYLVSQMGMAAVRGFQGDTSFKNKNRIMATLKHFAAHGQPESGTNCAPVNVSERLLRDVFLYPFREAVQKAGVCSVMASYNEIDGVPSHASTWLLHDVLRKEWGFEGFIVSDYYAIKELFHREDAVSHAVANDESDAAAIAAKAGVNIEFPDVECYPHLINLVLEGRIKESIIDDLVAGLLKFKFQMGLFEDPYVDTDTIRIEERLQSERALALRSAQETIILLKNENNILPLDAEKGQTIAVIGPNADRIMLGGYSGTPVYYTTVLQGIKDRCGKNINILYSEGCKITIGGSWTEDQLTLPDPEDDAAAIAEAVGVALKADKIILVVGGNEQTSREAWSMNHMGDRASLELFGRQNDLVQALVQTGKPVVVVLINGRPLAINYIKEKVAAILECWYSGQETGNAVADILFGNVNPSGKLPISFPRSAGHLPCYYNYKPSARRGYLSDDISPLFPFGYGLSYTSFKFGNLRLERSQIGINESTIAQIDVTNTGQFAGSEVVQLYIRDRISSVTRPVKELKGFKKIFLKSGQTMTVSLPITPNHLAFTDINMNYVVEPGEFEIMVGNSSRDSDLIRTVLLVN